MKATIWRSAASLLSLPFLLATDLWAQPEFVFGENSGAVPPIVMPGAEAEIESQAGSIRITSPNFWSLRVQMNDVDADFTQADPAAHLVIEVSCRTEDKAPYLELVLINAEWTGKAFYRFELSEAIGNEMVRVTSTTPIAEPVMVEGDYSPLSGIAKNLQILAKAERGNSPWEIELKSMGSASAD